MTPERPSEAALALARMRALGTLPLATDPVARRRLRQQAQSAGRELLALPGGTVVLVWQDGNEPGWPLDGKGPRRLPSPTLALAMSACLRACWTDRDADLHPGRVASVHSVTSAAAAVQHRDQLSRVGAARHVRGALDTLHEAGFIVLDAENDQMWLGPAVAAWSDRQVTALRDLWSRFPAPLSGEQPT